MSNAVSSEASTANRTTGRTSRRAELLAERLEQGALALASFAAGLSDAEWQMRVPKDGRKVGVTVHHVGFMYPIEIQVAQTIVSGKPVVGLTMDNVHEINAAHARDNDAVTKQAALDLLRENSAMAAAAIRAMSDDDLDRAVTNSMYADAPLTTQLMLEDHAVRHSYHHLAKLRATVGK